MLIAFVLATSLLIAFFLSYPEDSLRNSTPGLIGDGVMLALTVLCVVDLIRTMLKLARHTRVAQAEDGTLNLSSKKSIR